MTEIIPGTTKPRQRFPKDFKPDPRILAAGRYGTEQMCDVWGDEKTFEYNLRVHGESALILAEMYPDIVPMAAAQDIAGKANLQHVSPQRIREIEEKTGHDVIAIITALEEVVEEVSRPHINKAKTSADSTQPAKAMQMRDAFKVLASSVENLRDITIEKMIEWIDIPHMDQTHLYDAVPTAAGRPLAHYVEMLQSGLNFLRFVYNNSIMGKWGDVTGNHHSAVTLGIDGMKLQQEFCKRVGVNHMTAAAQLPGLEFEADVVYAVTRIGMTLNNLAKYIALGYGNDAELFFDTNPRKRKGSSGMPHKDMKGGNRIKEEQDVSVANKLMGWMMTALANCEVPYARSLYASANTRIDFEDNFKFVDHGVRELSSVVFYLGLNADISKERVLRTYGVVTSPQVMTYLTDPRFVDEPMARSEAHNLVGQIATTAWQERIPFVELLLKNGEVSRRLSEKTLREITDPIRYIGQSKEVIRTVADKCYQRKTLEIEER